MEPDIESTATHETYDEAGNLLYSFDTVLKLYEDGSDNLEVYFFYKGKQVKFIEFIEGEQL